MAWVAVDECGDEGYYEKKPFRVNIERSYYKWWSKSIGNCKKLKDGTIKNMIGKTLTWEDKPVEVRDD